MVLINNSNNSNNNNNNDDKRDGSDKTRNGDKNNSISIESIKKLFKNDILDLEIYQYLDTNLENMNGMHIATSCLLRVKLSPSYLVDLSRR